MADPHTTVSTLTGSDEGVQPCIAVRVLAHPNSRRVGDWAPLFDASGDRTVLVNRSVPELRAVDGTRTGPLASTRITRRSLALTRAGEGIRLRVDGDVGVQVNGAPVDGTRELSASELKEGAVVLFGKYLALWIGWLDLHDPPPPIPGLIGESSAMRYLRRQILRVAATDVPVLLRGETGVGKELVAAAIHDLSARASAAYVPVNAAGIPPTMAASELFGHRRGAFTGAVEDRKGYFSQADGGTLFLDEIGDISFDVQALLLRAVQHGVIQPLGGPTRQVNVRLVAATDSDLESAVARRQFREPLLRRFSFELQVPALRARRDDIGLLFLHLIAERLQAMGDSGRVLAAVPEADPWIPAEFVAALALHDWPGNVRELSNVALHFVLENVGSPRAKISDELRRLVRPRVSSGSTPAAPQAKDAAEIGDAEIIAALRAEKFSRPKAARRLGVSKSYLYKRLERLEGVRPAADIPPEEILSALAASGGDMNATAERLELSTRALLLRLRRVRPT